MKDKWKLLADSLTATELFNLEADHREIYNQLGEEAEIEAELQQALESFFAAERKE